MPSRTEGVQLTRKLKKGKIEVTKLDGVAEAIAVVTDLGCGITVTPPGGNPQDCLTFYHEGDDYFSRGHVVTLIPGQRVIAFTDEDSLLISGHPVNGMPGLRVINTFGQ
ncbi:hypothetical protein KBC75_03390 [Candidatus Shapirobacteria bacterium]|nr:hypothetical protein [Candidatus Shapirobacteria bacterium]